MHVFASVENDEVIGGATSNHPAAEASSPNVVDPFNTEAKSLNAA